MSITPEEGDLQIRGSHSSPEYLCDTHLVKIDAPVVTYFFEDKEVFFRKSDGYLNGTKVCDQFGKPISNWLRLQSTKELIDNFYYDLEPEIVKTMPSPIEVIKGGSGEQGTWLHPDLSIDLSAWLNVKFRIWMLRVTRKLLMQGEVKLAEEIGGLKKALSLSEEKYAGICNELALLEHQGNLLRYENDELKEIAEWRKYNSFTALDR